MRNSAAVKYKSDKDFLRDFFAKSPHFSQLKSKALSQLLQISKLITAAAKSIVFNEADKHKILYFLIDGRLCVNRGKSNSFFIHKPGEIIFDPSALNPGLSSYTLDAETESQLLAINLKDLESAFTNADLQAAVSKIISMALLDKLLSTEQKAQRFEKAQNELSSLKEQLAQRTKELGNSLTKLEEVYQTKELTFSKLRSFYDKHIPILQEKASSLEKLGMHKITNSINTAVEGIEELMEILSTINRVETSQELKNKKILIVQPDRRQQLLAKLSLGGLNVDFDLVLNATEAESKIESSEYDIVCLDFSCLEIGRKIQQEKPLTEILLLAPEDFKSSIGKLLGHDCYTKIISQNSFDRNFSIRNLHSAVHKIATFDFFGVEKYLDAGVKPQVKKVRSSKDRSHLIEEMADYLKALGVRGSIVDRCRTTAEELLMNVIYDAPVDKSGNSLYNHLPRSVQVDLKPEEESEFIYACDGVLVAISARDPFGSLQRDTLLKYIESCYTGKAGTLNEKKGGAGRGLFMLLENSDQVVFNVRHLSRTEVICLFNVDMNTSRTFEHSSIQMFFY